ncbi:AP2 domain transcription factor, putative, partial [Hepatocystis sp. ex Piliocolobus tephrosceles]
MQVITLDLDKAIYRIKKFSEPISYYDCTQSECDNNTMNCQNVRKHTYSNNNKCGFSTTFNTTDNEQNLGKDANTFYSNNNNDISNTLNTGYNDIYNNNIIKTTENIKTVDIYNTVDVVNNSSGTFMIKDENHLQENALFSNKNMNVGCIDNNDYDVYDANKINNTSYSDVNTTNKQSYIKKIAHHDLF